ncbi:MAG: CsgG/HfaB family protein [Bryobacteraceae bacterium]|nr:CsgG/HfaB family protein [Bryobacteraceae bacterium]
MPAKPAAVKAPAVDPLIDSVIQLKKAGMGDDLIVKGILKEKRAVTLGVPEMKLLKSAGVSDRVIGVLMDPDSATPAPAPTPTPSVVLTAPAPPPMMAPAATGPVKRRLAVEEFDFSTVKSTVQAIFNTQEDIGKGIRALLTTRLQQAGKITVLERAAIKKVMDEQDFGASNRVKKGTNAKIGRILGADAMLLGDIVAFGRDDRNKQVDVGAATSRIPKVGGLLGGVRVGKKEEKAVVVIAYRIVDAESSEVIETGEARGESKRESKGMGGLFGVGGTVAGGSVDMTSANFAQTIIGEAVISACDQLAEKMNTKIPTLPVREFDIEGRVADVSGTQLTLAIGGNDGVTAGDVFEIFKVLGEVKDPITKEVLDVRTEKIGEMRIVTVREKIAVGNYQGSRAEVGALARKRK